MKCKNHNKYQQCWPVSQNPNRDSESCGLCVKRPKNKQDYVMRCSTGLRRWNNESAQSSLQQLKRRWCGRLERSDIRAQRSRWPRETHTTQLMHVQDLTSLNLLHNTVYSVCLIYSVEYLCILCSWKHSGVAAAYLLKTFCNELDST